MAQLNVVVVNESIGTSRVAEYIHPLDQVQVGTDRFSLSTPELTWTGDRDGYTLSVKGDDVRIDLTATSSGPPLLMNGQGQMLFLALTAVHPDGTHVVAPTMLPVEATDAWTSPRTGRSYPTRCVVRAPQIGTELIIEVPYKEQEIVSKEPSLTKYEGAATVTGTYLGQRVTGHAYLELVGDWS